MAARKTTTTKTKTTAKAVDLQRQIVTALAARGVKARVKPSPTKRYVSLLVGGQNIGYVWAPTRNGVRVLVALQPGDLPRSVKGFRSSGRSGGFGAIGSFTEKTLGHAVAALKLAAKLQAEDRDS
jgi:hypothetical protein